jgi:hypothetical protein
VPAAADAATAVTYDPFATPQRAAPTRADAAGVTPDKPAGQPAQVRQCGVGCCWRLGCFGVF